MDRSSDLTPKRQCSARSELDSQTKQTIGNKVKKKNLSRYIHWVPVTSIKSLDTNATQNIDSWPTDNKRSHRLTLSRVPLCPSLVSIDDDNVSTSSRCTKMLPITRATTNADEEFVNWNRGSSNGLRQVRLSTDWQARGKHSDSLRHALYTGYSYSLVVPVDQISEILRSSPSLAVRSLGSGRTCWRTLNDVNVRIHAGHTFRPGRNYVTKSNGINEHGGENTRHLSFRNGYLHKKGRECPQLPKETFLSVKHLTSDTMSSHEAHPNAMLLSDVTSPSASSKMPPLKSGSKSSEVKHVVKTLSPSKHGYHPRSQSPTFKCLVAASELLQKVNMSDEIEHPRFYSPEVSQPSEGAGEEESSPRDRHPSLTNSEDIKRIILPISIDLKNQQRHRSDPKPARCKVLNLEPLRTERHGYIKEGIAQSKALNSRSEIEASTSNKLPPDHVSDRSSKPSNVSNQNPEDSRTANSIMCEVETNPRNGRTTHIHLFLPNILQGRNKMTCHSTDLVLNGSSDQHVNDSADDLESSLSEKSENDQPITNSQANDSPQLPDKTNRKLSDTSLILPSGVKVSDKVARKTLKVDKPSARHSVKAKVNYSRKRRVSVCTDPQKSESSSGRKQGSTQSSARSEHQLQSERLKKQLDEFPTLISLNYSEL
ncbi:uncharacterized protein LOC106071440 isoform X1 [Biomphalaria glabrata]|uniref:Uncharacterized protein LOC106071440 isoform X1 n=2 Tax=Biomphalaria glabrata TaxID=6526 RepID=A0A9U8EGL7_BIOGL|nr:uncharacterized protein LOC106071440 isoform X1 [Biomphalaria glabrata]